MKTSTLDERRVRCADCGYIGDRTFVRGADGTYRDPLSRLLLGEFMSDAMCSRCAGRTLAATEAAATKETEA